MTELIISDAAVTARSSVAGGGSAEEVRGLASLATHLGETVVLETGLLPPGVISIRQGGDYLQITLCVEPGIYPVIWGDYEGSSAAKTYYLAQPYRVVIGEFKDGQFLGARMFYSPHVIYDFNQPLYHTNLPNINCRGYGGTGVGWVCHYHHDDTTKLTLAQKATYVGARCSGNEAYNDGNMSETDGTRLYREKRTQAYLSNPSAWEKKSDKEGFNWTLDDKLWLPIKVNGLDDQERETGKTPLTVRMAMEGNAGFYYRDTDFPRLYNARTRKIVVAPDKIAHSVFVKAFKKSQIVTGMKASGTKKATK